MPKATDGFREESKESLTSGIGDSSFDISGRIVSRFGISTRSISHVKVGDVRISRWYEEAGGRRLISCDRPVVRHPIFDQRRSACPAHL